jgi:multiple sugar transport system permease protein
MTAQARTRADAGAADGVATRSPAGEAGRVAEEVRPVRWRRREARGLALRYLAAVLITGFFLFPIYWLVMISFKTPEEIFASPPVWYPASLQLDNFRVLFRDGDAVTVWNSLVVAGTSTVFAMLLGTIAAYSLARFRTGGNNLAIWIISQRMVPPIAIVFPVFLLYVWLGWVDSFLGLILLYTAFNLPYVIWMMRGYIEDIPLELEESALVDGCTRFAVLRKVVFPMARAGLFATAVFTFVFAWNDFIFALVLTRREVTTFPVQVTHYFGGQSNFWAKIAAMSVLGTVPIFIAVATLQRYLVRGISLGAVKG